MVIGQAIDMNANERNQCFGFGQHPVDKDTLKIIDCFKCPKCGHSDDGNGPDELYRGV